MKKNSGLLDLYVDYLIVSTSYTTATGMSKMLNKKISHDKITRFLSQSNYQPADLWKISKKIVKKADEDCLIIDDTISEKPYTDENDIVCYHFDHSKNRSVKGINIVTALHYSNNISLPVSYDIVRKTAEKIDKKTGKKKRVSPISKNEKFINLVDTSIKNKVPFQYVLSDIWYSSAKNMKTVKNKFQKDFIIPVKKNRKVALSKRDQDKGLYVRVDTLDFGEDSTREVWLEGVNFPITIAKQIFKNEDSSEGVLYITTSDASLTYAQITTIYKRRWKVEEFHKSLKNNASLAASPTKTVKTQENHLFASMCAFILLEGISLHKKQNHFCLKSILYIKALKVAYKILKKLHPNFSFDDIFQEVRA